jgi:Holliday junction DNA helicase RuvA
MISYIKGTLEYVGDNYIVVESNMIGYYITISGQFMSRLPQLHSQLKVNTYMLVREDEISLFGFYSKEELDIFKILISVSGVGPKVALSVLSALTVDELRMAVVSEDVKAITRANGIGNKGASRIILELKDKLKMEDILDSAYRGSSEENSVSNMDVRASVISALTSLGYTGTEAAKAVNGVTCTPDMDEETLLKLALKNMKF